MKNTLFSLLKLILRVLSRSTIKKYRPLIIGITGSVGKTSTKSAIYTVLESSFNLRMAKGNFNNEIGMPLTILGDYKETEGWSFWVKVILKSLLNLAFRRDYPKTLILEYAADRPGDLDYLLAIAKPDIAVVTALGDIPIHVEFYSGPEAVAKEKIKIVQALEPEGYAVLNFDDSTVLGMKSKCKGKVLTFGFGEGADVRITSFLNRSEFGKPLGISFKIETKDNFVPVRIDDVFGKSQAYAGAGAATVGLIRGVNLVKISEALLQYRGERGRGRLIEGVKSSYIIDDTYNASPLSTVAALDILGDLSAPRKVAILGDMKELGKYTTYIHEKIGRTVARNADVLVTVGLKARFIAEGARKSGFSKKNIYSFENSEGGKIDILNLIESRDLILVKGSQSMRMETIVLKIMAHPELAKELLVRQYGKWLKS